jgi:DNA-binding NarL/FixJ family response regulator
MLTAHKLKIADYVVGGRTNLEIAFEMKITEKTVKDHLTQIYKKIGVKNRAELIQVFPSKREAIEADLV